MNLQQKIKMTRKEQEREEYEEHFYASWGGYLPTMTYDQLKRLNDDKLKDINSSYPDTMLWLKSTVLMLMAEFEISGVAA